MFVGTHHGTGVIARMDMSATGATTIMTTPDYITATTNITTFTTGYYGLYVVPPTNGMHQFKGLTASADEKKYLTVICVGVAPVYATWAINLDGSGTDVGFIVNCYTGIPQCAVSLADGFTALNTSHSDYT